MLLVLQNQIIEQYYLNIQKMLEKQQQKRLQQQTFRYKIIGLFDTYVVKHLIPLHIIQVILQIYLFIQILKFPIDYFSINWFARIQPIISFLDPSYYLKFTGEFTFQIIFFISIVYMNSYWIIQLSLFFMGKERSHPHQNIKKLIFIINKYVLLLPLTNITISSINCNEIDSFRTCFKAINPTITLIGLLSFIMYTTMILFQQYLNFQILKHQKQFRRLKRSSLSTTCLLIYAIINQLMAKMTNGFAVLSTLNFSFTLLLIIFYVKSEELNERIKLIQLSCLLINYSAIILLNCIIFIGQEISICLLFSASIFIAFSTMKSSPYSLNYELENINKWHTSDIVIRYAQKLRYYISRISQYSFKIDIEGYMEVHKQKCDNGTCPLRAKLTEHEKQLFQLDRLNKDDQIILRLHNLIKKIYFDGSQQNTVHPIQQLQQSIFLYEKDQKQLSLKKLLLIQFEQLPLQMYYKYNFLKKKIHGEMEEEPDKIFLDLVSQLYVKENQRIILSNFQKAAMINLQFWSLLKEDHPNFKKLNQIGAERIKIRQQIKQNYETMSKIVNNQKITNIFAHYIESIENDEEQYNLIFQRIKDHYDLEDKIILQDWINSSHAILLVSIEESSYATIIDLNTTCSILFGYERYELLNRPVKYLFANQDQQSLKDFMASTSKEETYMLAHKNGYLLKIKKISKIYNSFQTGITAIINLSSQPLINTCSFAIRKDRTIIGSSSSIISLMGIQRKIFEKKVECKDFFMFDFEQISIKSNNNLYSLKQLVKPKYDPDVYDKGATFKIRQVNCNNCELLQLINIEIDVAKNYPLLKPNKPVQFQFQIQANLQNFKYFGSYQGYDNYVTQFSQLHYADSFNYTKQNSANYSQGIKTLRLNYDIIQVIQQAQEDSLRNFQRKYTQNSQNDIEMERKHEEEIFQNNTTFEDFVKQYKFARSVVYIFFLWMVSLLGVFIIYSFAFQSFNKEILALSKGITYQNLIIGSIAKEESLVMSLQLMKTYPSSYTIEMFLNIYQQNLDYLQQIKLKGVEPYWLSIDEQNYLTRQFLLALIKESNLIYSLISHAKSQKELVTIYNKIDSIGINFILQKGKTAKQNMIKQAKKSVDNFKTRITQIMITQILMFISGFIFLGSLTLSILLSIHKINQERIKIFSIFLDISQIKIQYFSSNTQKFLASLHTEDPNSEIDVDEQVQNVKKIHSSTFAKKKKLVQINFNKLIYVKFLIIPIIGSFYFIFSFVNNFSFIQFQLNSYQYFYLTSYADYKFYSGLSYIQESFIKNQTQGFNNLSAEYFEYYREYFELHFTTFGNRHDYHEAFTYIFMNNICQGKVFDMFGSTKIPISCNLPQLSQNGSYLIFTDMAIKTSFLLQSSLDLSYLQDYQTLSKTHRLISSFMLKTQQIFVNQAVGNIYKDLLIWTLVIGIVSFIFGLPTIYLFIDQINLIKNIITIIPISLVRELPLANAYLSKIIKEKKRCC